MDTSQIRGLVLFVCFFFNLILGLVLLGRGRNNKGAFYLGILSLFSALYAFNFGFFYFFDWQRLFWYKSTFFGVFLIPSFLNFVYIFSGYTSGLKLKMAAWYSSATIIVLIALATPYIVTGIDSQYPYINSSTHGFLAIPTRFFIILGLIVSLYYLIKAYIETKEAGRKRQFQYFIIGISIYSFMGVSAAGVLPLFFPKFSFIDLSVLFSLPWIGLTTYAIMKDKLFDIKVLLTETLVYFFGIILLVQMFFGEAELAFQVFGFFVFCFIGYLLIKTNRRDVLRSEILEQKVSERTKDLQASNIALEQSKKVAEERSQELEKWYKLSVGRELRMAELKEQIKEMEEKVK